MWLLPFTLVCAAIWIVLAELKIRRLENEIEDLDEDQMNVFQRLGALEVTVFHKESHVHH